MTNFKSFWAKARPLPGARAPFHPAWAHGLDVAAVGDAILLARPQPFLSISQRFGWDIAELRALWTHLLALHDIGKFSPLFQWKVPGLYPSDAIKHPDAEALKVSDPGHPIAGQVLLRAWLDEGGAAGSMPALFTDWSWRRIAAFLDPIFGHHGRPVSAMDETSHRLFRPSASAAAALAYWRMVDGLLPPPQLVPPKHEHLAAASWSLAGMTALADWIGSDQAWFPYVEADADISQYWDTARRRATQAVAAAGLAPALSSPLRSFSALTGVTQPPTDMQAWAMSTDLPDGPLLVLIEDVTGGGKTEAALMLAHRLLAQGRATGLYFALPTMATANAMFGRVEGMAGHLYDEAERPSLTLAHGRARLHPRFRTTLPLPSSTASDGGMNADGDSAQTASAWLMSESRKALLADLGIGTIDQALLAVLPVRHQAVRLAGLAGKVLIIDEAHSYDAYVGAELDRLVAFHAAGGGSTIILSATLPQTIKSRITAAWRVAVSATGTAPRGQDYPGATLIAPNCPLMETALAARADLCRTLILTRVPGAPAALRRIRDAVAAGACVAWVRNTVDDAIEASAALRECGIEADLFHARFAMGDRLAIETRVIARFGKTAPPEERHGRVLVATQVIEQSLDIDFDLVVSDLAPIDLLLQRAGRLWRHTGRQRPIAGPELVIVSPDPKQPVAADWAKAAFPRASAVYPDHALLWRTARLVVDHPAFRVPEDVRGAIEAAYSTNENDVPPALRRARNEAQGRASADRAFAQANLLDPETGYRADVQAWQSEAKIMTRLAEESRKIRLAKMEEGRLTSWIFDADETVAWALSEVTAYERKLRGRHQPEPRFEALAATARAGWSRYDEAVILLPLQKDEEGSWTGVLTDVDGRAVRVSYSATVGLRLP